MNKKTNTIISVTAAMAIAFAGAVFPVFAQTTPTTAAITVNANASATVSPTNVDTSVGVDATLSARINNIMLRADQEITRRVNALNALSARVNAMVKLSQSEKGALASNIQGQLGEMTALKAQVAADAAANSTTSLKLDVESITTTYRIFALILPQGTIEAASDRVLTTVGIMIDLGTKLSARISAEQAAGKDVGASQSAITDFNTKVSDANIQAVAAVTEISGLKPDGGNATLKASNTASLKDARAKIAASQQDLIAARVDAQTIIKVLGINISATASSSTQ